MIAASALDDLLVTAQGYERLRRELETLRSEGRRAMSERLREARADGHLEDNPALFDLLEEQAQLERRIATLEARLAAARIAEPNGDGSAGIGSSVQLRDLETSELFEYELVGAIEGDVGQGRVSVEAPVGRALLGAAAGDIVRVACPRGELRLEVVDVTRAERREGRPREVARGPADRRSAARGPRRLRRRAGRTGAGEGLSASTP